MQNTWSIGRTWKPREGWSRPVLTDERQHSFPDPFGERIILLQTIPYGNEHGMNTRRINASRPLSGSRAATRPADLGVWPYKRRFAAVMAQVRRPVPFRTRKLRPGTAMVLHSTGCGRVARRRITRTGSPDTLKVPGLSRISGHFARRGCISRPWTSASWASPPLVREQEGQLHRQRRHRAGVRLSQGRVLHRPRVRLVRGVQNRAGRVHGPLEHQAKAKTTGGTHPGGIPEHVPHSLIRYP